MKYKECQQKGGEMTMSLSLSNFYRDFYFAFGFFKTLLYGEDVHVWNDLAARLFALSS